MSPASLIRTWPSISGACVSIRPCSRRSDSSERLPAELPRCARPSARSFALSRFSPAPSSAGCAAASPCAAVPCHRDRTLRCLLHRNTGRRQHCRTRHSSINVENFIEVRVGLSGKSDDERRAQSGVRHQLADVFDLPFVNVRGCRRASCGPVPAGWRADREYRNTCRAVLLRQPAGPVRRRPCCG